MHFRACVLHVALVLAHPSLCAYVGRGGSRVATDLTADLAADLTAGLAWCDGAVRSLRLGWRLLLVTR